MSQIDWNDKKSKITPHFTVHDATWLPTWEIYHIPSEEEKANIIKTAEKLELIREYIDRAINVHVWIRPLKVNAPGTIYNGRNYNLAVGGAPRSAHISGLAVDWNPYKMTCSEARIILIPMLAEYKIRMENIEGNWVHIDLNDPAPGRPRFFRP